ncbi:MAG: hypothetical protein FGM52_01650, partial [Mycobacterium sp.]|nr:hypothetical protein [Mycobacterium sp.]
MRGAAAGSVLVVILAGGCKSNPVDAPPPTIEPATAARSPATVTTPTGRILPLAGDPQSALAEAGSLVVLTAGADAEAPAALSVYDQAGGRRTVPLPGPATALAHGDGD